MPHETEAITAESETLEIHPAAQKALDRLEDQRRRVMELNADALSIGRALNGLTVGRGTPDLNIYVGSNSYNTAVVSCWEVADLNSLTPLFRALRREGWRAGKPDDSPDLHRRTYPLSQVANESRRAHVHIFTPSSGESVCRWEQTGVEEKPVYKLVCGDQEAPNVEQEVA